MGSHDQNETQRVFKSSPGPRSCLLLHLALSSSHHTSALILGPQLLQRRLIILSAVRAGSLPLCGKPPHCTIGRTEWCRVAGG